MRYVGTMGSSGQAPVALMPTTSMATLSAENTRKLHVNPDFLRTSFISPGQDNFLLYASIKKSLNNSFCLGALNDAFKNWGNK